MRGTESKSNSVSGEAINLLNPNGKIKQRAAAPWTWHTVCLRPRRARGRGVECGNRGAGAGGGLLPLKFSGLAV